MSRGIVVVVVVAVVVVAVAVVADVVFSVALLANVVGTPSGFAVAPVGLFPGSAAQQSL